MILTLTQPPFPLIHRLSNVSKSSVSVRKYESAAAKWKTEIRNVGRDRDYKSKNKLVNGRVDNVSLLDFRSTINNDR